MVTRTIQVTCPECHSVNEYDIKNTNIIDNELYISYSCTKCGKQFVDTYELMYLGGYTDTIQYDKDNLISNR